MSVVSGGNGPNKLKAEINVTPLVDVVLVLLIIFMVVTPMLTRGREVQLPVAQAADAEHESVDAIVLTVAADKTLWLENHKVSTSALTTELKNRLSSNPSAQTVLIKADSTVTVKDLRPVLQKLKTVHISQIAFAVLEKKGGR
ncbi:MAG: tolR3 [Myxococcaceae bacterium]|nr:tolR3 [Myxococcaceae bacterium]